MHPPTNLLGSRLTQENKLEIARAEHARYAVYTLMLLGDDAQTLASHFEQLANQYNQAANNPATRNRDWYKTVAAMYQLAAARRSQGKEVKPLHPTANLD
jgi:hypothetical protein